MIYVLCLVVLRFVGKLVVTILDLRHNNISTDLHHAHKQRQVIFQSKYYLVLLALATSDMIAEHFLSNSILPLFDSNDCKYLQYILTNLLALLHQQRIC